MASVGEMSRSLTAVVLAGGGSRRLGGIDKTAIEVNGRSLLERVLAGWPSDTDLIVVGPSRPTQRAVRWCRESPEGGGPLSGLAAAMPLVDSELVAVVGGDMPLLGPAVPRLVETAEAALGSGADGAWLVSSSGRPQPLACCVSRSRLADALPERTRGAALYPVLQQLRLVEVPAFDDWLLDADTGDDLERVKHLLYRVEGRTDD
jgi:molybdopterin-guanine dinucleotide biosynthesis protein A